MRYTENLTDPRRHSGDGETVTSGDPVVLVMPGDGPHQLAVAQLPTYLKAEAGHR